MQVRNLKKWGVLDFISRGGYADKELACEVIVDAKTAYQALAEKAIEPEDLAKQAIRLPEFVQILVDGMGESKAEVKYGCAKALRIVTDEQPELLYPHFDLFAGMLGHTNKLFQWQALYVIAGLACVDEEEKLPGVLNAYFAGIQGPVLVTAANVIKGAATIVKARPRYADRIAAEVLRAEKGIYEDPECHEIACGAALKTFYMIHKWVSDPAPLAAFAERHLDSPREPTARAADKYFSRYEKQALAG